MILFKCLYPSTHCKAKSERLVLIWSICFWMERDSSIVLHIYVFGVVKNSQICIKQGISPVYTGGMVGDVKGKVNSTILTLVYEQPTQDRMRRYSKHVSRLSTNIRVISLTYLHFPTVALMQGLTVLVSLVSAKISPF